MGPPAAGIIEEVGKALVLLLVVQQVAADAQRGVVWRGHRDRFAAFESSGYAFRYLWGTNSSVVMANVITLAPG